ncbi:ATP-binding cassette domain-containing protein, partial [Pseudomonadales bacterium]|nr:ATP-binding cassette domain-containing protein [Pseudomonadales bacterium]
DVLKRVNAYEFVMALPNGLDTIVGDRGAKLSGGQRQRLSLARAIMRDVEFLILDEATSAMDQQLEEKIIEEIKLNFSKKTVLFITHRLATAVHADVIYRLDEGRITKVSKAALNKLLVT